MSFVDRAIGEAEACAAIADYTAAISKITSILVPANQLGAVFAGESFVALARAAAVRPPEDREAVLAYLVGRGRLDLPTAGQAYHPTAVVAYTRAIEVAYCAAMEGCTGRSRAAAIVSALRYHGGLMAPRRSPYALAAELGGVSEGVAEIARRHTPPAPAADGTDGFDARPAWAALAERCAGAPAQGCTLPLAAALFDAFHAACATRRFLGPNVLAASTMLNVLAADYGAREGAREGAPEGAREPAVTPADCASEGVFDAIVESGAVDMIEVYATTFGVPDEAARARAIGYVEAWRDSFLDDPPGEAGEVLEILRDAPLHETAQEAGGLCFAD